MKVIFFGTGSYYEKKKDCLKDVLALEKVGFIDNNNSLWGKKKENKKNGKKEKEA